MTRTDELGHRLVIVVALAKEDTFLAIADGREAIITDKDAMQPVDFCLVERAFSRFEYGTRPSLQTIDRRALSLNLEARAAVSQHEETGRASDDLSSRPTYGFLSLAREVFGDQLFELRCSSDDGAECARAEQVVPNAMAQRYFLFAREV